MGAEGRRDKVSIEHRISYYVLSALLMFDGIALSLLTAVAEPEEMKFDPVLAYPVCVLISAAFISFSIFLYRRASK